MKQLDSDMKIRSKENSTQHYSVPEDYFDSFTEKFMAQIPLVETEKEAETQPTRWIKLRPLLYLAASFLMMIGLFRAFSIFSTEDDNVRPIPASQGLVALDNGESKWNDDMDYSDFLYENSAETVSNEWVLTDFSE